MAELEAVAERRDEETERTKFTLRNLRIWLILYYDLKLTVSTAQMIVTLFMFKATLSKVVVLSSRKRKEA